MTSPAPAWVPPPNRYLVGPAWDLTFVINAPWLLFAAAHVLFLRGRAPDVADLAIYFVTLPHRFATLGLVFLDRDQLSRRPRAFFGLLAGFVVLYFASRAFSAAAGGATHALLCLGTLDYAWNAYHFGAQHYGITRIYARKAGGGKPRLERAILVGAVVYTLVSCANWLTFDAVPAAVYATLDILVAGALASLVAVELLARVPSLPKLLYLSSLTLLYGGILVLPYLGRAEWRMGFIASTGIFHAVEYLAIVRFYMHGKQQSGGFRSGFFRTAAPHGDLVIVLFALGLGSAGLLALRATPETYLFLYTVGSFCHYAYDGMIWKLRKPSVARALQVGAPA